MSRESACEHWKTLIEWECNREENVESIGSFAEQISFDAFDHETGRDSHKDPVKPYYHILKLYAQVHSKGL